MAPRLYLPLNDKAQLRRWLERKIQRNLALAERARIAREQAPDDYKLRDTKPAIYEYNEADRPIVVIGAGQHYRQDMREMAMRRAERPFLPNGPKNPKPHPLLTLRTAVDKRKRAETGLKVFHIANNPIGKEI